MNKVKTLFLALWHRNHWLTIAFLLTLAFAVFFSVRSIVFFIYWHNHFEEPIEGWMTIRYIAHSYRVEPRVIHDGLGLPEGQPDHRMLFEIARSKGTALDQITTMILDDIAAARGEEVSPSPDATKPQDSLRDEQ